MCKTWLRNDGINYKMRVYAPYSLNYYGLKPHLIKINLASGGIKICNGNHTLITGSVCGSYIPEL